MQHLCAIGEQAIVAATPQIAVYKDWKSFSPELATIMNATPEKTNDDDNEPVKELLLKDILSGKYRSGEWLKQVDLENTYNANRFEVRIALSELAARHLIDHIPNRGYRVIDPSSRERADLYELRTIVETGAARLVAQRVSDSDIEDLAKLVAEFSEAIDNKGIDELSDLNVTFHNRFYEICGNPLMVSQIQELRQRGIPGRRGGWDAVAGRRASNEDHAKMVEMLRNKDTDGLCYVVYNHLNRWREFTRPASD